MDDQEIDKRDSITRISPNIWRALWDTPFYQLGQTPPFSTIMWVVYNLARIISIPLVIIAVVGLFNDRVSGVMSVLFLIIGVRVYKWGDSQLKEAQTLKITRVNGYVTVYSEKDINSSVIAKLQPREEVSLILGTNSKVNYTKWIGVTLPDEKQGYIREDTPLEIFKVVWIMDEKITVFSNTSGGSPLLAELVSGDMIEIKDGIVIKDQGKEWVEIMLPDYSAGYIPSTVRISRIAQTQTNYVPCHNCDYENPSTRSSCLNCNEQLE